MEDIYKLQKQYEKQKKLNDDLWNPLIKVDIKDKNDTQNENLNQNIPANEIPKTDLSVYKCKNY